MRVKPFRRSPQGSWINWIDSMPTKNASGYEMWGAAIALFLALALLLGTPTAGAAANKAALLNDLARQAEAATRAGDYARAETLWTQILDAFPDNAAAWSNRGNARASQGRLLEALDDYTQAATLAPSAPDPYLNRGSVLEALGRWEEAIDDYNRVLAIDPNDAAGYNNRGSAESGLGEWEKALADFQRATLLDPRYATARQNYALTLFQIGQREDALRELRNLVRKYPNFADARAALTALLWANRASGEAESNWVSVMGLDPRYADLAWVAKIRRWPPAMVTALENFLHLHRSIAAFSERLWQIH